MSMRLAISLNIVGEPVAQGRPRFSTAGGFVRAYDPGKSRDYKDYIKLAAAYEMKNAPPLEGALALSVRAYRPIPKSMSKKKIALAEDGKILPITKPDLDNYVKAVKDALKGVCWRDDSQIVKYLEPYGKYYSSKPRIEVDIYLIEEAV